MVSSSNKQFKDLGDRSQSRRLCKKKRKLESIHNCAMLEIILSRLVAFASDHLNMKSLKLQAPWYFVLMETHPGTTPTLPIALLWNPMLPLLPAHTQQADLPIWSGKGRVNEVNKLTSICCESRWTRNHCSDVHAKCFIWKMLLMQLIRLIVLPLRPASPFGDCRTPSATSSWSDTRNTLGSYQTLKIFRHPLYTCLLKLCLHSFYVFFCCGPQICPHEVWDLKFFCDLPGWKLSKSCQISCDRRDSQRMSKVKSLSWQSILFLASWFAPEGLKSSFIRAFHWHHDIKTSTIRLKYHELWFQPNLFGLRPKACKTPCWNPTSAAACTSLASASSSSPENRSHFSW